ncbi:GH25 family lysozyme [Lapillicoccus jejuensis]|uniref:Lysozyme n=1 Tax=Lapillicoccus jejuensis TaxID=402171 RepID=A0A542E6A9_9MICO|nr:GH25 family lysozyme [Lapillicoccus jejuensis]TQJ10861.1 GH25 family lysozyme M1 (1,4-beta-N-acetylmuramidase) [Lapillicoccus jejuensis]
MSHRSVLAAALVAATALLAAHPAAAAPDPGWAPTDAPAATSPTGTASPTAAARAAGVTSAGGGFMGWSQKAARRTTGSAAATSTAAPATTTSTTPGIDVSGYQGSYDWASSWSAGKKFAYVKATEGTSYTNPSFSQQYSGSYDVGMFHGAYHFARPDVSSGATQASYFVGHGGGWSADGRTLPGALDIEYNPYGATCYGLSQSSMTSWINAFRTQYHSLTGVYPVIYSTYDWWSTCTGNTSSTSSTSPFWIARYSSTPGTLPAGYGYYTFWQYSDSPVDQDYFNGTTTQLRTLSLG